jgi:hypothetical protein
MPLKHVLSVIGLVDHPGILKLWAIAQENSHNRKNDKFFCHSSLECTECHGPCRSLRNPKTRGNSTKTALKHKNDKFLAMPLIHVLSVIDLLNHSGTLKLWAIAH